MEEKENRNGLKKIGKLLEHKDSQGSSDDKVAAGEGGKETQMCIKN